MKGFLRWDVLGNLGNDAEMRAVGDSVVCSFSVAVNLSYKKRDGSTVERTEWVRCSIWGGFAQAMHQYLKKGAPVFVSGEPQTREFTDREGNQRTATDLQVNTLQLLPNPKQSNGQAPRDERPREDRRGYGAPQGQRREPTPQQPDDFGAPNCYDGGDEIPF